jgi:hypothetical protein
VAEDAASIRFSAVLEAVAAIFFTSFVGSAAAQGRTSSGMFEQQMEQAKRALAVALDERAKRPTQEGSAHEQVDLGKPAPAAEPALTAESLAATSQSIQTPERMSAEWWVILGSYPEGASGLDEDSRRVETSASRCGVSPMRDQSFRYEGFAPGYTVLVLGAQPSMASARQLLQQVRPCVPDAYIKQAHRIEDKGRRSRR